MIKRAASLILAAIFAFNSCACDFAFAQEVSPVHTSDKLAKSLFTDDIAGAAASDISMVKARLLETIKFLSKKELPITPENIGHEANIRQKAIQAWRDKDRLRPPEIQFEPVLQDGITRQSCVKCRVVKRGGGHTDYWAGYSTREIGGGFTIEVYNDPADLRTPGDRSTSSKAGAGESGMRSIRPRPGEVSISEETRARIATAVDPSAYYRLAWNRRTSLRIYETIEARLKHLNSIFADKYKKQYGRAFWSRLRGVIPGGGANDFIDISVDREHGIVVYAVSDSFIQALAALEDRVEAGADLAEAQRDVIGAIIDAYTLHELGHAFDRHSGIDLNSLDISDKIRNAFASDLNIKDVPGTPHREFDVFGDIIADSMIGGPGNEKYVRNKAADLFFRFIQPYSERFTTGAAVMERVRQYYRDNPLFALMLRGSGKDVRKAGDTRKPQYSIEEVADKVVEYSRIFRLIPEQTVNKESFYSEEGGYIVLGRRRGQSLIINHNIAMTFTGRTDLFAFVSVEFPEDVFVDYNETFYHKLAELEKEPAKIRGIRNKIEFPCENGQKLKMRIGDDIVTVVIFFRGNRIRFATKAPHNIPVNRKEREIRLFGGTASRPTASKAGAGDSGMEPAAGKGDTAKLAADVKKAIYHFHSAMDLLEPNWRANMDRIRKYIMECENVKEDERDAVEIVKDEFDYLADLYQAVESLSRASDLLVEGKEYNKGYAQVRDYLFTAYGKLLIFSSVARLMRAIEGSRTSWGLNPEVELHIKSGIDIIEPILSRDAEVERITQEWKKRLPPDEPPASSSPTASKAGAGDGMTEAQARRAEVVAARKVALSPASLEDLRKNETDPPVGMSFVGIMCVDLIHTAKKFLPGMEKSRLSLAGNVPGSIDPDGSKRMAYIMSLDPEVRDALLNPSNVISGGPAASAVRVAKELAGRGIDASFISSVGANGASQIEAHRRLGIDMSRVYVSAALPIADTLVFEVKDDSKFLHNVGASAELTIDKLKPEFFQGKKVAEFGGIELSALMPNLPEALIMAEEAGCITVLDTVVDRSHQWKALRRRFYGNYLKAVLSHVSLFTPSIEEAAMIYADYVIPGDEAAAEKLKDDIVNVKDYFITPVKLAAFFTRHGAKAVFLKNGKDGVYAHILPGSVFAEITEETFFHLPILRGFDEVSNTGTGDAASGAAALALAKGWPARKTAIFADVVGGMCVAHKGGTIEDESLVDALYHMERLDRILVRQSWDTAVAAFSASSAENIAVSDYAWRSGLSGEIKSDSAAKMDLDRLVDEGYLTRFEGSHETRYALTADKGARELRFANGSPELTDSAAAPKGPTASKAGAGDRDKARQASADETRNGSPAISQRGELIDCLDPVDGVEIIERRTLPDHRIGLVVREIIASFSMVEPTLYSIVYGDNSLEILQKGIYDVVWYPVGIHRTGNNQFQLKEGSRVANVELPAKLETVIKALDDVLGNERRRGPTASKAGAGDRGSEEPADAAAEFVIESSSDPVMEALARAHAGIRERVEALRPIFAADPATWTSAEARLEEWLAAHWVSDSDTDAIRSGLGASADRHINRLYCEARDARLPYEIILDLVRSANARDNTALEELLNRRLGQVARTREMSEVSLGAARSAIAVLAARLSGARPAQINGIELNGLLYNALGKVTSNRPLAQELQKALLEAQGAALTGAAGEDAQASADEYAPPSDYALHSYDVTTVEGEERLIKSPVRRQLAAAVNAMRMTELPSAPTASGSTVTVPTAPSIPAKPAAPAVSAATIGLILERNDVEITEVSLRPGAFEIRLPRLSTAKPMILTRSQDARDAAAVLQPMQTYGFWPSLKPGAQYGPKASPEQNILMIMYSRTKANVPVNMSELSLAALNSAFDKLFGVGPQDAAPAERKAVAPEAQDSKPTASKAGAGDRLLIAQEVLAREAASAIPRHSEERFNLLMINEFFRNKQELDSYKKYENIFDIAQVSGQGDALVENILGHSIGREARTIVLLPHDATGDLTQAQISRLTANGIRFLMMDAGAIREAKLSGDRYWGRFQDNTVAVMLLARRIDTSAPEAVSELFQYYLTTHFELGGISVPDYIQAVVTNNIAILIRGYLRYRPIIREDAREDYDKIAPALLSA